MYNLPTKSISPKHVSHQVWLKLAKWFMRRRFLKVFIIKTYIKLKMGFKVSAHMLYALIVNANQDSPRH